MVEALWDGDARDQILSRVLSKLTGRRESRAESVFAREVIFGARASGNFASIHFCSRKLFKIEMNLQWVWLPIAPSTAGNSRRFFAVKGSKMDKPRLKRRQYEKDLRRLALRSASAARPLRHTGGWWHRFGFPVAQCCRGRFPRGTDRARA
jgi:hypothetical protein